MVQQGPSDPNPSSMRGTFEPGPQDQEEAAVRQAGVGTIQAGMPPRGQRGVCTYLCAWCLCVRVCECDVM